MKVIYQGKISRWHPDTGLWLPGETRPVSNKTGALLIATGLWAEEEKKPPKKEVNDGQ